MIFLLITTLTVSWTPELFNSKNDAHSSLIKLSKYKSLSSDVLKCQVQEGVKDDSIFRVRDIGAWLLIVIEWILVSRMLGWDDRLAG